MDRWSRDIVGGEAQTGHRPRHPRVEGGVVPPRAANERAKSTVRKTKAANGNARKAPRPAPDEPRTGGTGSTKCGKCCGHTGPRTGKTGTTQIEVGSKKPGGEPQGNGGGKGP